MSVANQYPLSQLLFIVIRIKQLAEEEVVVGVHFKRFICKWKKHMTED